MSNEAQKLGDNLKRIRIERQLSQTDIAETLGVSRGFVSNIENGKKNPTLSTISRLAEALKVSTEELFK